MHHTWLSIMPCSCVVCLLCCVLLLDSSRFVAIVRIRSSTLGSASSVRLLHGLFLLTCGISGKMTVTLDLTTIIAMLVASFYRFAALTITCLSSFPYCHEPLTFDTFPTQTVVWLCYHFCSAPLIALPVAGTGFAMIMTRERCLLALISSSASSIRG